MNEQPTTLRLADELLALHGPTEIDERAAVELRRLHKQAGAYALLVKAQEKQLAYLSSQQVKWTEAINTLQSERDANAILTGRITTLEAALRQALEALERGETNLRYQTITVVKQTLGGA